MISFFRLLIRNNLTFSALSWIKIVLLIIAPITTLNTVYAADEKRLISTDAGVTELIFSLGFEDDLIAVDVTSQLPPGHPSLPNIGYHRTLSAEGLMSLNPSAVIGSEHIGPASVVTALKQANIQFIQLRSAKSSQKLRENIRILSAALEQKEKGEELLKAVDKKLSTLNNHNLAGERVAFLLSMDDSKLRLAGEGTTGDSFIRLMKGKNISDFKNYRNVSAESLLEMQPTVIIVAGRTVDGAVKNLLDANPVLAHTPAVKNRRIVAVNGSALVAGLSVSAINEAIRLTQKVSGSKAVSMQESL